eukprot:scaffold6387_cov201-Alexandrium_tamarense.AAC.3
METALVNRIAAAGRGREGRWFMGRGLCCRGGENGKTMYNLKTTNVDMGRHPPIALATWNCWARPLSSK